MSSDETGLTIPQGAGMSKEDEEALIKDDGLGFLTLMHGVSKAVMTNQPNGIRAGDFLLNGRVRIPGSNSGPGFRAGVILSRPRAILFKNDAVEKDSFRPSSPDWVEISGLVSQWVQGAKVGMEFLLWLPDHDALAVLPVFNKERFTSAPKFLTARNEKRIAQVTTTISGKKNSVGLSVTVLPIGEAIPFPDADRLAKVIGAFEAYKLEKSAPQGGRQR